MITTMLTRLRGLLQRRRVERELDDEVQFHIEMETQSNVRRGMSPSEARRRALCDLGGVIQTKEAVRYVRTMSFESLWHDVRGAVRSLRRQPGFTATVTVTLALGVGANAALFGLVDALIIRPPAHVHEPQRLVEVKAPTYVRYRQLSESVHTLDLTAYTRNALSLGLGPEAIQIRTECVTPTYFPLLGARPLIGRAFTNDDEGAGREPTAVIAHGLWRRQFGGDATVLGRRITIAGRPFTVIGVAPRGYRGIELDSVDAWILLTAYPEACSFTGTNLLAATGGGWLRTIGRLRPGVTAAHAAQEIATVASAASGRSTGSAALEPLYASRTGRATALLWSNLVGLRRESRLALWLAGGAFLLLLLACANVAGLLSMRGIDRRREVAVRLQLGASRFRVFRQLLCEHLVLAVLAGAVAILVAVLIDGLLRAYLPFTATDEGLSPRFMTVLAAFALLAGALSGTVPALRGSRADLARHLRAGDKVIGQRAAFRNVLLIAQIALGLVLVVAAGLFVRSVQSFRQHLGYDLDRPMVAALDLRKAGYHSREAIVAVYQRMLARVQQVPLVETASLSSGSILDSEGLVGVTILHSPDIRPGAGCCHAHTTITPDYFRTVGVPLVQGRAFTPADDASARPVIIVDEGLARTLFGGKGAIGKCVAVGNDKTCREIVGVSASARRGPLRTRQGDSQFFVPLAQQGPGGPSTVPQLLLIRPQSSSRAAFTSITAAIRTASPNLPFVSIRRLRDLADEEARAWLMGAKVLGLFGALAVAVAAVGIYGTLAFSIRQRTSEIGVRIALGARPRHIARMVLWHGVLILGIGLTTGGAVALATTRLMQSVLFEVAPTDAAAFFLGSTVVVIAGLAGCLVPAVRAARIDPAVTLRYE